VTNPVDETVATLALVDSQVAWFVTVWVVPFESVAVAVNCAESPGFADVEGAVTVTTVTVGVSVGFVGVLDPPPPPHATKVAAKATATANAPRTLPIVALKTGAY
jgi:hypothetical protein